ncbi:MAG TPA: hypothetical protein VGN26_07545 [Armatimonadota bacterium]|jgi:hypothetical protein
MSQTRKPEPESTVTLERQPSGATLLFVAETRNAEEILGLQELFDQFRQGCRVLSLAVGPITAFAVRALEGTDPQELSSLLETLAPSYRGRVEVGFNPSFYRHAVEDAALELGSKLVALQHCDLCHQPDPFPTRIHLRGRSGESAVGLYCERCVAQLAESSEREMIDTFLHADTHTFGQFQGLRLSSRPVRQGNQVRFTTHRPSDRIAATG